MVFRVIYVALWCVLCAFWYQYGKRCGYRKGYNDGIEKSREFFGYFSNSEAKTEDKEK